VALTGNLHDLAVVELIQLLQRVHQTGLLVMTSGEQQARLYYRKGRLVDARNGGHTGIEALVDIVDWDSGKFEFEQGLETQEDTIQMDLHHVIMQALKIRDERKEEARLKEEEEARIRAAAAPSLGDELAAFVAGTEIIVYAALASASGELLAEARASRLPADVDELRDWLLHLANSHPGRQLRRVFVENEVGTSVVARLEDERIAVVVAERGAPFGAASLWMGKLAARFSGFAVAQVDSFAVQQGILAGSAPAAPVK
jgi:hypothetical protein